MADFLRRMKQRKLVQWALAYLAGAWVLLQVLGLAVDSYHWPDAVMRLAFAVLALGLAVALVLAWYHGERGEQKVSGTELLLIVLVLAIGGGLLWRFAWTPEASAPTAPAPAATTTIPSRSIAVLPFVNMSGDRGNEFFSDGMSEELLNALAQVRDLKVAGRTSSFYYKGRNEDLRAIGKALGVAYLLEGSVRKQGDQVRITAQLIRVADDTHLWSRAYDGNLSDVFQLQENIARAITDQLKVVLVGTQKTRLVPVATTSTQAYTLYLQATDALNRRDYEAMGDAIGWLNQAIALDPDFARAHAQLAMIHALGWAKYGSSQAEAERQARLAMALDPSLAEPEAVLGIVARDQRRYLDARAALDRALLLEPDNAAVNLYDAQLLIVNGYARRGIARLDRALEIDPMLPNALHWRAVQYFDAGDMDAAERLWRRAGELRLSFANAGLSLLAKERGDFARARSLTLPYLLGGSGYTDCLKTPVASASAFLEGVDGGDASERAKALAVIDECLAAKPAKVPYWVASGLLQLDPERALRIIAQGPTTDEGGVFMRLWGATGRAARRSPEFPAFVRQVGLAALWDKYGPPDDCSKNVSGDYVCAPGPRRAQ